MTSRRFRVTDEVPATALTWTTSPQRMRALQSWRRGICIAFSGHQAVLTVAWALHGLFTLKDGFAYPTDAFLVRDTGLHRTSVERALTTLERNGAIARVHRVGQNGETQRHIYPSVAGLLAVMAGRVPAAAAGGGTRSGTAGHNYKNNRRSKMPRTQLDAALCHARAPADGRPLARDMLDPADGAPPEPHAPLESPRPPDSPPVDGGTPETATSDPVVLASRRASRRHPREDRTCQQCHSPVDGQERLISGVWLHPECWPFFNGTRQAELDAQTVDLRHGKQGQHR